MSNFIHEGMQLPFNPCRCGGSPAINCETNRQTGTTVLAIKCTSCMAKMIRAFTVEDEADPIHPITKAWQDWNESNPVNKDGMPFKEMLLALTVSAASSYQAYLNTMRLISKLSAGHEMVGEPAHQAVHDFVDLDTGTMELLATHLCAQARKS